MHESADIAHIPEAASDSLPSHAAAGTDGLNGGDTTPRKRTRSRNGKNIIFRVFPEEHGDISARASEAGLTISEFIRRVVAGHRTQSRFDYDVMEHLIRMHADMNRLGNLFRMSLKQGGDGGEGTGMAVSYAERERQRSILASIGENQELLRNYIGGFTA
jgi:hypothetical protein